MTVNWGSPDSLSQAAIQIEQPFLWLEEKMTMKIRFYILLVYYSLENFAVFWESFFVGCLEY